MSMCTVLVIESNLLWSSNLHILNHLNIGPCESRHDRCELFKTASGKLALTAAHNPHYNLDSNIMVRTPPHQLISFQLFCFDAFDRAQRNNLLLIVHMTDYVDASACKGNHSRDSHHAIRKLFVQDKCKRRNGPLASICLTGQANSRQSAPCECFLWIHWEINNRHLHNFARVLDID